MGFAGQVFAARVAIGLAMPSPRALTQAGSALANFSGKVYKSLNQQATRAASDRLRLAKQDLQRANKALSNLNKEHDNSLRKQAQNSIKKTNAMFGDAAFKTKKSIGDFQKYITKVQPSAAPRMFAGMNKDMSAAKQYQKMVTNFISLGKEERKVILNNMKARSLAMKTQAKDFKDLVNAMKPSGGGGGGGNVSGFEKGPPGPSYSLNPLDARPRLGSRNRGSQWYDYPLSVGAEMATYDSSTTEGAQNEQIIADVFGKGINEDFRKWEARVGGKTFNEMGSVIVENTAEQITKGANEAMNNAQLLKASEQRNKEIGDILGSVAAADIQRFAEDRVKKLESYDTSSLVRRARNRVAGIDPSRTWCEPTAKVEGGFFARRHHYYNPSWQPKPYMTQKPLHGKWGTPRFGGKDRPTYHGDPLAEDPQDRPGYQWGSGVDPTRWPEHARLTKEAAEETEKTAKAHKSIEKSMKKEYDYIDKAGVKWKHTPNIGGSQYVPATVEDMMKLNLMAGAGKSVLPHSPTKRTSPVKSICLSTRKQTSSGQ